MRPALRLRQRRLDPTRARPEMARYEYDPTVESQGLTVDTGLGPVDLVAVQRAMRGFPTPITPADMAYLYGLLPIGERPFLHEEVSVIAAGLGITPDAVKRRIERTKASAKNGE